LHHAACFTGTDYGPARAELEKIFHEKREAEPWLLRYIGTTPLMNNTERWESSDELLMGEERVEAVAASNGDTTACALRSKTRWGNPHQIC